MRPQRMIILKHRRNSAGRHKTGCPSLRNRKKVYRKSYTLVERCLTRTSQISFVSFLHLVRKRFLFHYFHNQKIGERQSCFASQVVLRVIPGGVVPPSSPNPDPISEQKMSFSTPVFRPDIQAEIMSQLQSTGLLQRTLQGPQISVLISESP